MFATRFQEIKNKKDPREKIESSKVLLKCGVLLSSLEHESTGSNIRGREIRNGILDKEEECQVLKTYFQLFGKLPDEGKAMLVIVPRPGGRRELKTRDVLSQFAIKVKEKLPTGKFLGETYNGRLVFHLGFEEAEHAEEAFCLVETVRAETEHELPTAKIGRLIGIIGLAKDYDQF